MNKKSNVNKIVKIGLLVAIAFVLMQFELALPIFPSFLKIDVSDIPALVAAFAFGPITAVIVEFVKNLLNLMVTTSAGVGELANFLVGSVLVFTAGSLYKRDHSKKNVVKSLLISTLVMAMFATLFNYFILLPLYEKVLNFPISAMVAAGAKIIPMIDTYFKFVLLTIFPFNLLKGVVVAFVTGLIYDKIKPLIKIESKKEEQRKAS